MSTFSGSYSPEAQAELRIRLKPLWECPLPKGFRLATPQPRQSVVNKQVRWVFVLQYGEWSSRHLYEPEVPDEVQMQWAVREFQKELSAADVMIAKARMSLVEKALQSFDMMAVAARVM